MGLNRQVGPAGAPFDYKRFMVWAGFSWTAGVRGSLSIWYSGQKVEDGINVPRADVERHIAEVPFLRFIDQPCPFVW